MQSIYIAHDDVIKLHIAQTLHDIQLQPRH